jgi:pimeloyl-ACP methyl ester carboxylesterase
MGRPTHETAKRANHVVHYSQMPRGGHFAALEQPKLFVEDLRAALGAFH